MPRGRGTLVSLSPPNTPPPSPHQILLAPLALLVPLASLSSPFGPSRFSIPSIDSIPSIPTSPHPFHHPQEPHDTSGNKKKRNRGFPLSRPILNSVFLLLCKVHFGEGATHVTNHLAIRVWISCYFYLTFSSEKQLARTQKLCSTLKVLLISYLLIACFLSKKSANRIESTASVRSISK